MTTIEEQERRRKLKSFALAYADPTSQTYQNAVDAWLFAFAPSDEEIKAMGLPAISRRAHRARYSPFVQKHIKLVQEKIQTAAGLSMPEYMQLLLKREAEYSRRGIPGDAAASARLLQFLGKAAGHLADKPLIDPNAPTQPLLSGEEIANALIDAAQRLQRLRQPNPMPQVASAEIIVEEEK